LQADFGAPLPAAAREAASALLSALVDLMRCRPADVAFVRELLASDTDGLHGSYQQLLGRPTGWLARVLELMGSIGCGGIDANAGGAAFVHACHVLALAVDGDDEMCKRVRNAGGLAVIGQSLLWATTGGTRLDFGAPPSEELLGTQWMSFATAAVRLLEVLVNAQDPDRFLISNPDHFQPVWVRHSRPDRLVDACLAAMQRSLNRELGCMVAQALHLSGLRTLGWIAHLSNEQARRIMCHNGLSFGAALLAIPHIDEEATTCALWYLAELSASSNLGQRRLKDLDVASAAERALQRYPRSGAIQHEALRVLAICAAESPPVAKTEASASARLELNRHLAERLG